MNLWQRIKRWFSKEEKVSPVLPEMYMAHEFHSGVLRSYHGRRYGNPFEPIDDCKPVASGFDFLIDSPDYHIPVPTSDEAIRLLKEDRERRVKLPQPEPKPVSSYKPVSTYTPPMVMPPVYSPALAMVPITIALGIACF